MTPTRRPTAAELAAANGATVADIVAPGLGVLFCGINPGLYSGAVGHHFARPGNRFWKVLHLSGFTPVEVAPDDDRTLLGFGIGITNVVARTTATAVELTRDELAAGGVVLRDKVAELCPRVVAVLGVGAYRSAFDRHAGLGRQPEPLAGASTWVLPNPSGLQARYQLPDLVALFGEVREVAFPG